MAGAALQWFRAYRTPMFRVMSWHLPPPKAFNLGRKWQTQPVVSNCMIIWPSLIRSHIMPVPFGPELVSSLSFPVSTAAHRPTGGVIRKVHWDAKNSNSSQVNSIHACIEATSSMGCDFCPVPDEKMATKHVVLRVCFRPFRLLVNGGQTCHDDANRQNTQTLKLEKSGPNTGPQQ